MSSPRPAVVPPTRSPAHRASLRREVAATVVLALGYALGGCSSEGGTDGTSGSGGAAPTGGVGTGTGSSGTEPPAGAIDGAYIAETETVVAGGEVSDEPMPEPSDDPDAPLIVSAGAVNVDDDEAEIEVEVDSPFPPTEVHIEVGDTHVVVPVIPPVDDDEGTAEDLPGFSFDDCFSDPAACYAPCSAPCEVYQECGESSIRYCVSHCSAAANKLQRCRTEDESFCPSRQFLDLCPESLEEFAARYVEHHRFFCSDASFNYFCAPPSGVSPHANPDELLPDQECEFAVRAGLSTLDTEAPPRRRRKVRVPVQCFNFPAFAQAEMAIVVTTEGSGSEDLASGRFEGAEVDLGAGCPPQASCEL